MGKLTDIYIYIYAYDECMTVGCINSITTIYILSDIIIYLGDDAKKKKTSSKCINQRQQADLSHNTSVGVEIWLPCCCSVTTNTGCLPTIRICWHCCQWTVCMKAVAISALSQEQEHNRDHCCQKWVGCDPNVNMPSLSNARLKFKFNSGVLYAKTKLWLRGMP